MTRICHRHCPDEGTDIGLLLLAGAAVTAAHWVTSTPSGVPFVSASSFCLNAGDAP